jgi:hypothetical protein
MDSVKSLNYAPKPPAAERYLRRTYRMIVLLAVVAVMVLWGPGAARWGRFLYWEHRCLEFAQPPDHVFFDWATCNILHSETCFPLTCFDHSRVSATIFLHEMRRPDGTRCLVALNLVIPPAAFNSWMPEMSCQQWIVSLVPRMSSWNEVNFPTILYDHHWKFFAGHADATNRSHVTFDYELDGRRHTCDGWLNNAGQLIVSQRP